MVFRAPEMKEGIFFNMRLQEHLETMFQLGVPHTLRCLSALLYDAVCPVFSQDLFIIFYVT